MKGYIFCIGLLLLFGDPPPLYADSFTWPGAIRSSSHGLNSPIESERIRAIENLSKLPLLQIESLLLPIVGHKNPKTRRSAASVLVSRNSSLVIKPLSRWLTSPHSKDRILAVQHLRHLGDSSLSPVMLRALSDRDDDVVIEILKTLALLDLNDSTFSLVPVLEHKNPRVRLEAAKALLSSSSKRPEEAFTRCLEDRDLKVVALCMEGLKGTQNELAIRKIIELTRSKKSAIQQTAIRILGFIHTDSSIDTLFEIADLPNLSMGSQWAPRTNQKRSNRNTTPKKLAIHSLVKIAESVAATSNSQAMDILLPLFRHLQTRHFAKPISIALKPVQTLLGPHLIQSLNNNRLISPTEIIDLIAYSGHEEALPSLYKELERHRISRSDVLDAIAKISSPKAVPFLLNSLKRKDGTSKEQLLKTIRASVKWGSPGAELLSSMLAKSTFQEARFILESIKTIGYTPTPNPVEALALSNMAPVGIRKLALNTLAALKTCSKPERFLHMLRVKTFQNTTSKMLIAAAPGSMRNVAIKWSKGTEPFYVKLGAKILLSQELSSPQKNSASFFVKLALNKDQTISTIGFAGLSNALPEVSIKALLNHADTSPQSFTARLLETSIHWESFDDLDQFIQNRLTSSIRQIRAAAYYALSRHSFKNMEPILKDALKSKHQDISLNASYAILRQNLNTLAPLLQNHKDKWIRLNGETMSNQAHAKHSKNTLGTDQRLERWQLLSGLPTWTKQTDKTQEKKRVVIVSASPTDGAFAFRADNDGRFFRKRDNTPFSLSIPEQLL